MQACPRGGGGGWIHTQKKNHIRIIRLLHPITPCFYSLISPIYLFFYVHIMLAAEIEEYIAEQFNEPALPLHTDLLISPDILKNPVYTLTDYKKYSYTQSPLLQPLQLPPNFIIGFSYKPDLNTMLRLFTINVIEPPSVKPHLLSSILLSSSLTLVQQRTFTIPWTNFTHTETNDVLLHVRNGELNYCINGKYVPHIYGTNLWLHNISRTNLQLEFNPHLRDVADRVCPLAPPLPFIP